MIRFCAQVNNWEVIEINIQPDHVHLLIQTTAVDSPSSIMQRIKGGTSKKLRELFPDSTESRWMDSFWAGGYFAGTVGTRNLKDVKDYVKNQQTMYHVNQDIKTADY